MAARDYAEIFTCTRSYIHPSTFIPHLSVSSVDSWYIQPHPFHPLLILSILFSSLYSSFIFHPSSFCRFFLNTNSIPTLSQRCCNAAQWPLAWGSPERNIDRYALIPSPESPPVYTGLTLAALCWFWYFLAKRPLMREAR